MGPVLPERPSAEPSDPFAPSPEELAQAGLGPEGELREPPPPDALGDEGYEPQREQFVQFTLSISGALTQNALYDLDHPSAKQALALMYEHYEQAIVGRHAVSYAVIEVDRGASDLLVEGYFPEPQTLSRVLPPGMASLIVPRLLKYYERHHLYSFTLLERLRREELSAFVSLLTLAALGKVKDLAAEVKRRDFEAVRVVFQQDVVRSRRTLAWRTTLALSLLLKDLKRLAHLAEHERLGALRRQELLAQTIDDVIRPTHSGEVTADVILNLDLIEPEARKLGFERLTDSVVSQLEMHIAGDVLRAFVGVRERIARLGLRPSMDRPDLEKVLGVLTRQVVGHLADDDRPTTIDFVEQQLRVGALGVEGLPAAMRRRIEVRLRARRVLADADAQLRALGELGGDADLAVVIGNLDGYRLLAPELLYIGGQRFLAEVSIALRALALRGGTPPRLRALIPETLRATAKPELLGTLVEIFGDAELDKDRRLRAVEVLCILGEPGLRALVDALCKSEDRWVRRTTIDALKGVGSEVELIALEPLSKPESPWFVVRNMLLLLEHVGTARSDHAAEFALRHEEPRVRAEAVRLFAKLRGAAAEAGLLEMLRDSDDDVRIAAVEQLGVIGSKQPALLKLYAHVLDPDNKDQHSDRLRVATCVALARLGNIPLDGVPIASNVEELLCAGIGGAPQKILFVKLRRKMHFGDQVREIICRVLGQIGGEASEAVLADVAATEEGAMRDHARAALRELGRRLGRNVKSDAPPPASRS
jgi:HEAT repeat protein